MKTKNASKSVLVTGGAVRIGREICLAFAAAGYRVVVHCHRSLEAARKLLAELEQIHPAGHLLIQADLLQPGAAEHLLPIIEAEGIRLDCLVNSASQYRRMPLEEATPADFDQDYGINFRIPFQLMQAFAARVESGVVINLLDERVARIDPGAGFYGLAKKSLRDATEAAAVAWAPRIRVNGVAPGLTLPPPGVPQDRLQRLLANVPLQRQVAPEELAAACVFLAETPSVTGLVLFVDGGKHLVNDAVPEVRRSGKKA